MKTLCGELEAFGEGEIVAIVDGVPVEAPGRGFVLRAHVAQGARVVEGTSIPSYRIA